MTRRSIYTSYASTITVLAVTAWFTFNGLPLKAAPEEPQPEFQSSGEKRIRIAPEVAQSKKIHSPRPAYPPQAKASRTQGTVRLAVLIAKDGHVKDLYTMFGPPVLREAAETAVINWIYQTTLLNGDPVEVVTTVDVNFTLSE